MNKTLVYPVHAVFPSRKALHDFIESRNPIQGKYLIAGSNIPEHNFIAFYNPNSREIELELKGESIDKMVNAGIEFFRIVDNIFKR